MKVLFTYHTVLCSVTIVRSVINTFATVYTRGISRVAYKNFGFHEEAASLKVGDGGEKVTQLRQMSFLWTGLVAFILSTELSIKWNHISGVESLGSTGQLIPLIIGGSGLVKVLYKIIVKCVRGEYGELFLNHIIDIWSLTIHAVLQDIVHIYFFGLHIKSVTLQGAALASRKPGHVRLTDRNGYGVLSITLINISNRVYSLEHTTFPFKLQHHSRTSSTSTVDTPIK